jgi:Ser/Thr protein kinase RdoA (MazF antagonist)
MTNDDARFEAASVEALVKQHFGIKADSVAALVGELDLNFRVASSDGQRWILKIAHLDRPRAQLELENQAMRHLRTRHFELGPVPVKTLDGSGIAEFPGGRLARLFGEVPGGAWADQPGHSPELLFELGVTLAKSDLALADFSHPHADRPFQWNLLNAREVLLDKVDSVNRPDRRRAALRVANELLEIENALSILPRQVVHNDANDTNVLVSMGHVCGLIDFGDLIASPRICNLAICSAYAIMNKPDPLRAATSVMAGYHSQSTLTPGEIVLLPTLIAARLAVSGTIAATRTESGNPYHQSTADQVWDALLKLQRIDSHWCRLVLFQAASYEEHLHESRLSNWLYAEERVDSAPLLGPKPLVALELDLSAGSPLFNGQAQQAETLGRRIEHYIEANKAVVGIGRYLEQRPIYTEAIFALDSNDGPARRDVHLGIDIFAPARTQLFAPLDGIVVSAADNAGQQDFGPTLILRHSIDSITFYTLYGHLSRVSLQSHQPGNPIRHGELLAEMGDYYENGGWPPHLHFQVISHLLGNQNEFPGVAWSGDLDALMLVCPDPMPLVRGLIQVQGADQGSIK